MTSHHLKRSIAIIVSLKVLLVVSVAIFVFGPQQRPHVDSDSVRNQLLDNSSLGHSK